MVSGGAWATYADDLVESCVRADGELGAGNVVVDRRRNDDDRNTELGIFVPRLGQHERAVVRLHTPHTTSMQRLSSGRAETWT